MSEYKPSDFEKKWQQFWDNNKTFQAEKNSEKPKFYVLDMFPYPSGAGLHVGHPLGYIASDIIARYLLLHGYNVLHPMGFDAFGLPAEQYAIQTGKHPEITTKENIATYISQLKKIGFAYDWDRQVNTSDPNYYKWTQWIFLKLFHHWYDRNEQKARPIEDLIHIFEQNGNTGYEKQMLSGNVEGVEQVFSANEWKNFSEATKESILMNYRLAYQSFAYVNWCEALGTVLANDEVKDGVSERGGYPVERRRMRQWFLRITEYAERLNHDLDHLDWSDSMKEMQRNWIGRSEGAVLKFIAYNPDDNKISTPSPSKEGGVESVPLHPIGKTEEEQGEIFPPLGGLREDENSLTIDIFTTRPDTIFGVSFMVLAPEHELVPQLTTANQKEAVESYIKEVKNRSERERQADVKRVSGVFTGSYAKHPFTGAPIPIWIADYVLVGYGTGAIMGVPAHDGRDFRFAKHFGLPIPRVIIGSEGEQGELNEAFETKEGILINSDFLNGLEVKIAIIKAIDKLEELGIGERKINYKLRDANFSRQRYWGEPFPIYYENGIARTIPESELPLLLPVMEDFKPTGSPEGPLSKLKNWKYKGFPLETDTMPGFAGSSWYFLRYMSPDENDRFVNENAEKYWQNVDLYIGGTEHAVGHLLYSRFWQKFLFDLGYVSENEPFKKLINQGMIQGRSNFVYQLIPLFTYSRKDENTKLNLPEILVSNFFAQKIYDDILNDDEVLMIKNFAKKCFCEMNPDLEYLDFQISKPIAKNVDIKIVNNDILDIDAYKKWRAENKNVQFILEDGKYVCGWEVEKMSKSKLNVVNPDEIVEKYGADTLRMYEMFLGPLEQSKPWNTNGIEGVFKFLKKFWRLFHNEDGFSISDVAPNKAELKILHKTIKKVNEDVANFSFNTCVSAFMIAVNELSELKCNKREILEPLVILISPFTPHIAEELWEKLGHNQSVSKAQFPTFDEKYIIEDEIEYPVSFNGKVRFKLAASTQLSPQEVEALVVSNEQTHKWLEGKTPKKIIVVPKRIVNVVM